MESLGKRAKDILLDEMLGVLGTPQGDYPWRVLVLDKVTTRVVSSAVRMSALQEKGISHVEDLRKKRQPLALEAVYFISPTRESIMSRECSLLSDFSVDKKVYPAAHVFFSSNLAPELLNHIRQNKTLVNCLKTLKEANLELLTVDSRSFKTDQDDALRMLFGERSNPGSGEFASLIDTMASRLVTVFSILKEFPTIRFRRSGDTSLGHRAEVAEKVAQELFYKLQTLQRTGTVPSKQTCDLLVLDRGFDPVAPVIHEFTYEAMVYDLEGMDGDVFQQMLANNAGTKEVVLGEHDELWREIRHMHIAEASATVNDKIEDFRKKNEAAKQGGAVGNVKSASDMRKLIQALPEFRDVLSKLALHTDISHDLFRHIDDRNLKSLGELEQDLVYGDKTSKDFIYWLTNHQGARSRDKMRLFMCYLATHPEKLDSDRRIQWQNAAKLQAEEMATILNLEYLGVVVSKKDRGSSRVLRFGRKKRKGTRKERENENQEYALARFQPLLADILEDLVAGNLTTEQFPYVNPQEGGDAAAGYNTKVTSVRTKATSWAHKGKAPSASNDGGQSRRIVVFVIGGFTRSEMRAVHKLSNSLSKDIILGGTCVETPDTFLNHVAELSNVREDMVSLEVEQARH